MLYSHTEFMVRAKELNPDCAKKIVGRYTIARDPIDCYCKKHEYAFSPLARSIFTKTDCKFCVVDKGGKLEKWDEDTIAYALSKRDLKVDYINGSLIRENAFGERTDGYYGTFECMAGLHHENFSTSVSSVLRVKAIPGCPICNGVKPMNEEAIVFAFQDHQTMHYQAGSRFYDEDRERWAGVFHCKTNPNHQPWPKAIRDAVRGTSGCPDCGQSRPKTLNEVIELTKDKATLDQATFVGWTKKAMWQCKSGLHTFSHKPEAVAMADEPCKKCRSQDYSRAGILQSLILQNRSHILTLAHDAVLTEFGNDKVFWKCLVNPGHRDWPAKPAQVIGGKKKSGCPHCSGNAQITEEDMIKRSADRADIAYVPNSLYRDDDNVLFGIFTCLKHERDGTFPRRAGLKSGCPKCAKYGYTIDRPGSLYCLPIYQNGILVAHKWGITNRDVVRRSSNIQKNNKSLRIGEPLFERGHDSGECAHLTERKIQDTFTRIQIIGMDDGRDECYPPELFKSIATLVNASFDSYVGADSRLIGTYLNRQNNKWEASIQIGKPATGAIFKRITCHNEAEAKEMRLHLLQLKEQGDDAVLAFIRDYNDNYATSRHPALILVFKTERKWFKNKDAAAKAIGLESGSCFAKQLKYPEKNYTCGKGNNTVYQVFLSNYRTAKQSQVAGELIFNLNDIDLESIARMREVQSKPVIVVFNDGRVTWHYSQKDVRNTYGCADLYDLLSNNQRSISTKGHGLIIHIRKSQYKEEQSAINAGELQIDHTLYLPKVTPSKPMNGSKGTNISVSKGQPVVLFFEDQTVLWVYGLSEAARILGVSVGLPSMLLNGKTKTMNSADGRRIIKIIRSKHKTQELAEEHGELTF